MLNVEWRTFPILHSAFCILRVTLQQEPDGCSMRSIKGMLKGGAIVAVAGVALGMVADRLLLSSPHYHGPVSDHFDGRRFHNQELDYNGKGLMKWQLNRHLGPWRDWVAAP